MDVSTNDPILLYYDNLKSIHLAWNPIFHARIKHIEVHYHFIRERFLVGDVDLQYISMNLLTIDILTKVLGADKLQQFTTNLGLSTSNLPSLRGSEPETWRRHKARKPITNTKESIVSQAHTKAKSRAGNQRRQKLTVQRQEVELEGAC